MPKITFYPDFDTHEFVASVKGYQAIWDEDGSRIVTAVEKISRLSFVEKEIQAIVFEGKSQSHPLRLRASYSPDTKKATLIHELCHRLISGNKVAVRVGKKDPDLEIHKQLDLVLYDIWVELYGEVFAKKQVVIESGRTDVYRLAWEWALVMTKETRAVKFKSSIERNELSD